MSTKSSPPDRDGWLRLILAVLGAWLLGVLVVDAPIGPPRAQAADAAVGSCSLVTTGEMAKAMGFPVETATWMPTGGVPRCEYEIGGAGSGKVILYVESDEGARSLYGFTKRNGEAVSGLGSGATWWPKTFLLTVETAKGSLLSVNLGVATTAANKGDLKGAAIAVARSALPRM